ncbi:response regulator containing CheY-like receiver AAA-type ATPase and DNA-binding domains [Candidatus Brocadia sinica JPN1]|uniref:Response regulator containing CheY-like receiver AAA-type ATPase and DNA-binding domains n=1 Tax=Candidatus Brocadia sinica JPN1 TaxID=1197129 RepID=A0ABQ0JT70_9BACT|nr:response regulator containing CheY-like receiver AAA-type ATPase and DNA-binding domains [Candidatus Brocadia sinica JPN1]
MLKPKKLNKRIAIRMQTLNPGSVKIATKRDLRGIGYSILNLKNIAK